MLAEGKGLVLDLEATVPQGKEPSRILMIGAFRPDLGETLELKISGDPREALRRLDALAEGAEFLLGHNLDDHDLPLLRGLAPDLQLLRLPSLDTLRLSPLAFPQNPYHRLVKDYKLIRESLNSPLADCRAAWSLFQDQIEAFRAMAAHGSSALKAYRLLLAPQAGPGLGDLFAEILGGPPEADLWPDLMAALARETDAALDRDLKICRKALEALSAGPPPEAEARWALAYALAWQGVSGGDSVPPPWVRLRHPQMTERVAEWRDRPCGRSDCLYCLTTHDPRRELKRWFGLEDFRREPDGSSLQERIVEAGMRGSSVLAVLPTGGGKSLCYQLPAVSRHHRDGSLTVVISPLQSLMKDQVDGLRDRGLDSAAALNGLLTLPERAEVMERLRMGGVGLLFVSPEQFRNPGFARTIAQRRIGGWIFDEAHCLSKWGADFRPDYLYAARFIREFSAGAPPAPIGCFTATAKPDVLEDLKGHFRKELGIAFQEFIGGVDRPNLAYEVVFAERGGKRPLVLEMLRASLGSGAEERDGAVIFVSSRRGAEELAEFLQTQDFECRHFHAGLPPHEKKDVQEAFIDGRLRVIVATNAFGMGVDKPDVRLVIHMEIPGSLENYLQEAGRAGRDRDAARCVLLYDPADVETQFGLGARSMVSQKDVQQVLKRLRAESDRRKGDALVISPGEILLDEEIETSFAFGDRDADTKIAVAVAALENARLLKRDENRTRIFPARLKLSPEEAEKRLLEANLPARRLAEYRALVRLVRAAPPDRPLSLDALSEASGLDSAEAPTALRRLEELGVLANDARITVYLRHRMADSSKARLERALTLERALFRLLQEEAGAFAEGEWTDLRLPLVTSRLREETGREDLLPLHVARLLRGLAQDRDGESRQRAFFQHRSLGRDLIRLRLRGGEEGGSASALWRQVEAQGEVRRAMAAILVDFLVGRIPASVTEHKDVLVESAMGELRDAIDADLILKARPFDRTRALEHVLLYLHQQEILTLNHGMTILRRAMTISMNPEMRQKRYAREDHRDLEEHGRDKLLQIHSMREYAEAALRNFKEGLKLMGDYFALNRTAFVRAYFRGREEILKLATSEASWTAIVGGLTEAQKEIVTAAAENNLLVLAGPGSGKTRLIVHRIAYLLRVQRVPASAIIALTFNRHAAVEIRRRLFDLVGAEAWGLTVLTYHGMAMRLTGSAFSRRAQFDEKELDRIMERAADLLKGDGAEKGGEDDLRERLIQGYRYIFVDEYQDIDARQYALVHALAGRRAESDEEPLRILAVGDDDQNIYAWRGGDNQHIAEYQKDYGAQTAWLVENHRSTAEIISAANALIAQNASRLKTEHPIRIDAARREEPPTGRWAALDPERGGRLLRLSLPESDRAAGNLQAQAVTAEFRRLKALDPGADWSRFAALARTREQLHPLAAWCEREGVPFHMPAPEGRPSLTRLRGFLAGLEALRAAPEAALTPAQAAAHVAARTSDPRWRAFFAEAFAEMEGETGDGALSSEALVDRLYDYAQEIRRQPGEGLYLGTIHSAKGLEFDHVAVLDGGWRRETEEERRLYYVAMTRARETLTLCAFGQGGGFVQSLSGLALDRRFEGAHDPALDLRRRSLELSEVDLGFPARGSGSAAIRKAIAELKLGDPLGFRIEGDRLILLDSLGRVVGRCSGKFRLDLSEASAEVEEIFQREATDGEAPSTYAPARPNWEVVLPGFRGFRRG